MDHTETDHCKNIYYWLLSKAEEAALDGLDEDQAIYAVRDAYSSIAADLIIAEDESSFFGN